MNNWNISFENEIIFIDPKKRPVYQINWNSTNLEIIKILSSSAKYKSMIDNWIIDVELDWCQIEIKNNWPKEWLDHAQEELIRAFEVIESTAKDLWLAICDSPVPHQDFIPMFTPCPKKHEKYQNIHNKLMWYWVNIRKATNIAWLHMHWDIKDLDNFSDYCLISNTIKSLFESWEYEKLQLSAKRLEQYSKVVETLNKDWTIKWWIIPLYLDKSNIKSLFDENNNPLPNYLLVWIKKKSNLTCEIRTADWVNSISWLIEATQKLYDFRNNILW